MWASSKLELVGVMIIQMYLGEFFVVYIFETFSWARLSPCFCFIQFFNNQTLICNFPKVWFYQVLRRACFSNMKRELNAIYQYLTI